MEQMRRERGYEGRYTRNAIEYALPAREGGGHWMNWLRWPTSIARKARF